MESTLKLSVVTPGADVLNVRCEEVVAPGESGEIGLLPGHISLITALRPGVLTVVQDRRKTFYAVSTGFAEFDRDELIVLTDACEEASTIDAARAGRALEDAERQLKTLGPEETGYADQSRRAQRARARLDAVERRD